MTSTARYTRTMVLTCRGRIRLKRVCTTLRCGGTAEVSFTDQPDFALLGSSPHPAGLHPSEMSRVHVLRQPESLTCGVVHHSLLSHAIVTCVLFPKSLGPLWRPRAFTPVDTAAYSSLSHDESDTAFCFLDQDLKSLPLWTSIPPLTERLSSRFAAQSVRVCHDSV